MIVHDYLGVDLDAVWLVVVQGLPPLSEAWSCMLLRVSPSA